MNKHWYILKKDHHLGPFSILNLRDLFNNSSFNEKTQLWCEGDDDWKSLEDQGELHSILNISNDEEFIDTYTLWLEQRQTDKISSEILKDDLSFMPDLPVEQESNVPTLKSASPPDLPPLPDEDDLITDDISSAFTEKDFVPRESLTEDDVNELKEKNRSSLKNIGKKFFLLFFLSLVILIGTSLGILWFSDFYGSPKKLNISDRFANRVEKVISSPRSNTVTDVVLAKDGKEMFAVINYPFAAQLDLRFTSIDKKVLSSSKIVFRSQVSFDNYSGKISKIVFSEGKTLKPGHYRVTLKGVRTGFVSKILDRVYATKVGKYLKYIYDPNLAFYATGVYLISKDSEDIFSGRLDDFYKELREKKLKPFKILLEKYKTVEMLGQKLEKLLKSHLKMHSKRRHASLFERKYSTEIGIFLQSMVNRERETLSLNSDRLIPYYESLIEQAIVISGIGSKIAEDLGKRKRKFNLKWKSKVVVKNKKRISKILNKIKAKELLIRNEMLTL